MAPLIINILAAVCALIAAGFWWASALVKPPEFLGWGTFAPDNFEEVKAPGVIWAEKTAYRNKWGAAFAGLAAFLTAMSSLAGTDWSAL
jgi:hypothetical protein